MVALSFSSDKVYSLDPVPRAEYVKRTSRCLHNWWYENISKTAAKMRWLCTRNKHIMRLIRIKIQWNHWFIQHSSVYNILNEFVICEVSLLRYVSLLKLWFQLSIMMLVIHDKLYLSSDVKFVSIKDATWFVAFVIADFGPFFKYTHTHTQV